MRAVPERARYCSRRRPRSNDLGVGLRRRVPGLRARDARCALLLLLALIDADAGAECRTVPRAVESAILKAVVITLAATNKSAHFYTNINALPTTLSGADARAPDAVIDAVARPFLKTIIDTDAAAHGKLRADASAYHITHFVAISGALSSTIDELRPDNRRPAVITTNPHADADPVAGALDGRTYTSVSDGVPARRGRY